MPTPESPTNALRRDFLLAAAAAPIGAAAAAATPVAPASPGLSDTSAQVSHHRVHATIERPAPEMVERFRRIVREVVTEHLGKSQIMDPAIKALVGRPWDIVGPAVTVDLDSFDHLMCIAALGVARRGDVIVVAAHGHTGQAVWGSGLTTSARNIGIEAVVVDGAVLNTNIILQRELPVFCRASHPVHGSREKPGSVNVPVSCGGVIVQPGDLILGDLDGIVVVPRVDAGQIAMACEERTARLLKNREAMLGQGKTFFELVGGRATIERAGVQWIE